MRIVCLESPFKPTEDEIVRYAGRYSAAELLRQNLIYARLCLLNSLKLGEAPLASHLLYTQVYTEAPELRAAGIKAGIQMHHRCDLVALCIDLGVSSGMRLAADNAKLINTEQTRRSILDVSDGKDPRSQLAKMEMGTFPYLEELQRAEQADVIRITRGSRA